MKWLLILTASCMFAGCATKPYVPAKVENKYYPYELYATAEKSKTEYLINMKTKREVGPNVYSIWEKDTSNIQIISETIVDCNSLETMTIKMVVFNDGKVVYQQSYKGATFKRQIPGTVGYALIEKVCIL